MQGCSSVGGFGLLRGVSRRDGVSVIGPVVVKPEPFAQASMTAAMFSAWALLRNLAGSCTGCLATTPW